MQKIDFVILEGPDCCGKSTQSEKLCLSKKFERVVYVHFPRVDVNEELKKLFSSTLQTIYDQDYMDTMVSEKDEYKFNLLSRILYDNIIINGNDKINFLKTMYDNVVSKNNNSNNIFWKEFNSLKFYYKGVEVKYEETDKEFFKDGTRLTVVLDRFDISGYCYNLFIISNILKEKYLHSTFSYKIKDLYNKINDLQEAITINIEQYKDVFEACDCTFRYIFFKPSKNIEYIVNNGKRKQDGYDKCAELRKWAREFYSNNENLKNTHINHKNHIFIDTDETIERMHISGDFSNSAKVIFSEIEKYVSCDRNLLRSKNESNIKVINHNNI